MLRNLGRTLTLVMVLMMNAMIAAAEDAGNAYQFAFTSIDGTALPLSSFKGKAVLVVEVGTDTTPKVSA